MMTGADMGDLLRKWLAWYDPIHRGWTPRGIAGGTCATSGFCFPRVRGGYLLRRASGGAPTSDSPIAGAAGADACEVREWPWMTHVAGTAYVYRLHAVNGGGVEEKGEDNTAVVEFDGDGLWTGARPNRPTGLWVRPIAGGRFELRWGYAPRGEQAEPSEFRVFTDGGGGAVEYAAAVGQAAYRAGRRAYRFVTPAFAHGARVRWAVRAVTADGVDDGNTATVVGVADAIGPLPVYDLAVEVGPDT